METKQKFERFSDEEIEEMQKLADLSNLINPVLFEQNTCECGDPIERIGLSDYYLHLHHGKLFDKVRKTSARTNCEDPKPRRIH